MRKSLLSVIAAFFILSVVVYLTRTNPLSLFFQGISQSVFHAPKVSLYALAVDSGGDNEFTNLQNENRLLLEKMADYNKLKSDNEALHDQFRETTLSANTLIPAQILGFQGALLTPEAVVIDKGSNNKVRLGQPVVVGKNLIGIVERVSANYSSVTLVNNSEFQTIAKTESNATGIAKGAGEFIVVDRVTINENIKKNDLVMSRGTVDGNNQGIPPDLIIGKVVSVKKVESEPFQVAQVKSLVDMSKVSMVFVKL
jgi:cell shape-determining protein MreC